MPKTIKKKIKVSITLDKEIWRAVDLHSKDTQQKKSDFINEILNVVLGSSKSFIEYELFRTKQAYNVAHFKAQNYNTEFEVKEMVEKLKAGR